MRIPAFVAAATALTLGLGASIAVGLTAAADPPPTGWDVIINSDPLYPSGTLSFDVTNPAGAIRDNVLVLTGTGTPLEEAADCTPFEPGQTTFSCTYTRSDGDFPVGIGTIEFVVGANTYTVDFTVSADPGPTPPPPATGPPSMSYEFTPAGIIATGTPTSPATKVATTFYYYTGNPSDQWESTGLNGCPVGGYDGNVFDDVTNVCSLTDLAPGIYNPYSQQDNGDGVTSTGAYASDYFVVPPTPTISAEANGNGSVSLEGTYPSDFMFQAPAACTALLNVYGDGTWNCLTGYLAPGDHTFSAYAYDNGGHDDSAIEDATYMTGGRSALATTITMVPETTPGVSLSFAPGEITVSSQTRGFGMVARTDLYSYDAYSEGTPLTWVADCGGPDPIYESEYAVYYFEGSPFEGISEGLEDYGCTFGPLTSGPWQLISMQDDGAGNANGADNKYAVIPEVPEVWGVDVNPDGSVDIYGSASFGDEVHVIDGDGNPLCTLIVDESAEWFCTTDVLPEGELTVRAYSVDIGEGEGAVYGATYVSGGASALTAPTEVNVIAVVPTMTYKFVPGGVLIHGEPAGNGTVVYTQFYSWSEPPADSEGGGFDLVGECGGTLAYSEGEYFEGATPGPLDCAFTNLAPGVWNPYSQQDVGDGIVPENHWVDDYFVVPATPTLESAVVQSTGAVVVSGSTVPGNKIWVLNGASQIVCSVVSNDETGDWSCTTPVLPNGAYSLRAYSEDRGAGENERVPDSVYFPGGLSALTAATVVTVDVPALPETGGNPAPPPTLITPSWFFSLGGIDLNNLHPGDTFTISGSGLPAGSKITVELHSTPVTLGTVAVAANGSFSMSATVPENAEVGDHKIVVTLTGDGLAPTTKEQAVTITPNSESAGHSAEASGSASQAGTDAHGAASGELSGSAPNILTNSMNPIVEVLNDPGRIPAAFAAGLVLIIFAVLPAHLLNSTIAEQYERFARRIPALRKPPKWYTSLAAALAKAPALGGVLLMAATGFLFAFADPKFGFNLHSLRLILALSAALFVVFFVANWITASIMRRVWNVDVVVRLRPLGLILTVVGVIVSRILEFSPGFLVGVVLGLSIASSAAAEHAWKAVLIRASVVTTFGIGSWVVYSSIAEGVHHDPTFWNELVLEFFVAIATEGIVLLLVELLPLHMLEGERLYKKSKVLWSAVYIVVLVVFILAVVPWEGNWRELGESFWPWFTAVAIFGAVCVAIYLYFRFIAAPLHPHGEESEESDPEIDDDERIAVGNDR